METLQAAKANIEKVVNSYRKISDRERILKDMGYTVLVLPMGSGGVLQEKVMKDKTIRIQITSGWGRWNYAKCVVLNLIG